MSSLLFLLYYKVYFLKEELKKNSTHTPTSIQVKLLNTKIVSLWLATEKHLDLPTQELSKCSFQATSLNSNTVMTFWITAFNTFPRAFVFYILSAFQKYLCQTSQIWNMFWSCNIIQAWWKISFLLLEN